MAANFGGAADYYEAIASIDEPLSVSCLFNADSISALMDLVNIQNGTDTGGAWRLRVNGSGNILAATRSDDGGTTQTATTSTAASGATWYQAGGVFASATDRRAFLNGAGKGTDANSVTTTGKIELDMAAFRFVATLFNGFSGKIAEVALWNVALSDAEMAELGKFVCPLLINPGALVAYVPLVRATTDPKTGNALTAVGSPTVAAHAPVIYWRSRRLDSVPAATAAGGDGGLVWLRRRTRRFAHRRGLIMQAPGDLSVPVPTQPMNHNAPVV